MFEVELLSDFEQHKIMVKHGHGLWWTWACSGSYLDSLELEVDAAEHTRANQSDCTDNDTARDGSQGRRGKQGKGNTVQYWQNAHPTVCIIEMLKASS